MSLLIVSFLAGILTVLAPCILPVIPVIVGASLADDSKRAKWRPYIIIGSLIASIVAFTMLLRASTALLGVPQEVWQYISGGIIAILGISFLFPKLWDTVSLKTGSALGAQKLFASANSKGGVIGAVLTGLALGPVFTSCSPTYLFVVASVVLGDLSFIEASVYITAYAIGLCLVLLAIVLLGRKLIKHLGWALNPEGVFRRSIGGLLLAVGIAIIFGWDKDLQALIINSGLYAPIEGFEASLRQ